jgi:hypothetical protein
MQERGFFSSLFDFSFSEFITTKIIRALYILGIIADGLTAFGLFLMFARGGGMKLIAGLVVAPIVFIVLVISLRVWLELVIVAFNIADNTRQLVEMQNNYAGDQETQH